MLLALRDKYPSAQLTVLQAGASSEETPLPGGIQQLALEPGAIQQTLNGLVL